MQAIHQMGVFQYLSPNEAQEAGGDKGTFYESRFIYNLEIPCLFMKRTSNCEKATMIVSILQMRTLRLGQSMKSSQENIVSEQ